MNEIENTPAWRRLFARIGNPLDFSTVDRCVSLIIGILAIWGLFFCTLFIAKLFPDRFFFFNLEGFLFRYLYHFIGLFILLFLLLIGLRLRLRNPESSIFKYIVTQFLSVYLAFVCYAVGPATHPFFIFFVAGGIMLLLLFELSTALSAIATSAVLIVCAIAAAWVDLIPYAPLFAMPPFVDGKIIGTELVSALYHSMIISFIIFFVFAYTIVRWRDRESRLKDMTVLLKKMFGRYLSTEVMNSLIENPLALELGGERRKVTIMMTDLRGFTALSERLEPEQVVQMLNAYFEVMVDVVLQYNGTINEIIGDALLIIFGAPQEMPDRAQRAIACAIEMQNVMTAVNQQNRAQGLPELEMGIGLNETEVVVGNIGSSKRSKYAVVGSGVNMTSRIESYTVGGQILISESVRQEAGKVLRIDGQRDVLPKGSETALRIYEVGGIAGRFNLALEEKDPALVTLARQIPLQYMVLEGKNIGKKGLEGSIVRLSKICAEITLGAPVDMMTNLKMNLGDVDEKLSSRDFYGKVIKHSGEKGQTHAVRFTSVPPEVDSYFQSHRQHAAKSAAS